MRVFLVVVTFLCVFLSVWMYNQQTPQASVPVIQGPNYNVVPKSKPKQSAAVTIPEPGMSKLVYVECKYAIGGMMCITDNPNEVPVTVYYTIRINCQNGARLETYPWQDVAAHSKEAKFVRYESLSDINLRDVGWDREGMPISPGLFSGLSTCDQLDSSKIYNLRVGPLFQGGQP